MTLGVIIFLVAIVLGLLVYNYSIHKKIDTYTNLNQRVTSLSILQEFMNTLGEQLSVNEKLEAINDILISKYMIKYSTIVIFDGSKYVVKASNVDKKHWDVLRDLQSFPIFADSIKTATSKYITVENDMEKLPYQKSEFGRAKCAMFFPLYVNNVYIGYWIIEGSIPHEFDKIDTTILEVVRNNIVTMLKTIENQATLENIIRDDEFSGLKSVEYLYSGIGKKTIDQYGSSAIVMFKLVNLPQINLQVSRKTGNEVITVVSKEVQKGLAKEYLFVRYMGPKFVIAFSGVDKDGVSDYVKNIKPQLEKLIIPAADDFKIMNVPENSENMPKVTVSPRIRFVISRYYKGTSLDGVLKRMEEFIDQSDDNSITIL
jgi:GGDEF domain